MTEIDTVNGEAAAYIFRQEMGKPNRNCACCSSTGPFEVHHLVPRVGPTIVLCADCHHMLSRWQFERRNNPRSVELAAACLDVMKLARGKSGVHAMVSTLDRLFESLALTVIPCATLPDYEF